MGLEPTTPSLQSNSISAISLTNKELTSTPLPVCTRVCTSEGENANADALYADQGNKGEGIGESSGSGDPLAAIAAAIAALSPADRQRLSSILIGYHCEAEGRVE